MIGRDVGESVEDVEHLLDIGRALDWETGRPDIGRGREEHLRLELREVLIRSRLVLVVELRVHVLAIDQERGVVEVHRVVGEVDLAREQFLDDESPGVPVVLAFGEDGDGSWSFELESGIGLFGDEAIEDRLHRIERRTGNRNERADEGATRTRIEISENNHFNTITYTSLSHEPICIPLYQDYAREMLYQTDSIFDQ